MIELTRASFQYENSDRGVRDISLSVKSGECVVLTGLSGCGKTTVTRLVNGLAPSYYPGAFSGSVRIDGKDISRLSTWEIGRLVGSVFQDPKSQFFSSELAGEVAFPCENYGLSTREILLLALQSCEIEDEYMYDKGLYTIDWDAAADSSSVTLIDRFWNTEENYFNYGNDGSIKDFHYWPQAHAMDVMIDAYNRTGDSKYSDLFDKWYVGIKAKNGGSYWNNFYDDMEWIALTMIRLYEVTDENKYLETSQEMWNEIKTGWNDYAGGGIAWTHDRLWSKNACSNGPAALIAARLYRINGNQEDLDWAVNIYKWERENLFNPATGAIYDNVNGETGELSTLSLSYNQGTFLGAAYELYKITGEESYLKDARKAANFGISNSSMIDTGNNLLRDHSQNIYCRRRVIKCFMEWCISTCIKLCSV